MSPAKFRALITDISYVAKLESEMLAMEMVDLEEVIRNIEWSLADKIKRSGGRLNLHLDVTQIRFSKKTLRSILFNLISNGIKFRGSDPPVIDITCTREKENVVLSIQDNGIGISKENMHAIFNMYGRLNHAIEGQGIGLSLTKKIVDAANGNIVVESEPGKGSKFIIYFKCEPEAFSVPAADVSA